MLVRDDEDRITGVGDLAGVKVAVQSGSSSVTALNKAAPEAQQVPFDDQPACLNGLKTKQVDAYVVDYTLLLSALQSNEGLKIVGDPFTEDPYGIGLPHKSDAKAFVDTFLQTIYDDGTWASISEGNHWRGSRRTTPPNARYRFGARLGDRWRLGACGSG